MALERERIEKRDFPIGRRGYDPAAVDAHLSTIADEVESMEDARRHVEPVAAAISDQVRGIVEAAEKGATEIHARAQQDAREIKVEATRAAKRERQQATREAKREREQAAESAREYVGQVTQSTSKMLERLEHIDLELSTLTSSVQEVAERLQNELEQLEGDLGGLSVASGVSEVAEEDALEEPETVPEPELEPTPRATEARSTELVPDEPAIAADAPTKLGDRPPELAAEPAASEESAESVSPAETRDSDADDDSEGARLIALNMALNGTSRDETDRYLAENFSLADRKTLLDEVYASVEG